MNSFKILAMLTVVTTSTWLIPQKAIAQQPTVSFQLFYDELSPYGMWVDHPTYGYVWIPETEPGFSPYGTAGHWIFTDVGWMWVSDYPWGWAAFHYGRWDYDGVYGWFWVPDNEWGPAWVSWRRSPGYYGWAPLRPGISISIAFGKEYRERNERWIFVRDRNIIRSDVSRHYISRTKNATIIINSTVIVNSQKDDTRGGTYITGPARDDVQRVTHSSIQSVTIREKTRPGQHLSNAELRIYRPEVQKESSNGRKPAPSKVMKTNEVKPVLERNAINRQRSADQTKNVPNGQSPKPQQARPSENRGRERQLQNAAPSRKNGVSRPARSGTNQRTQDKEPKTDKNKRDH